MSAPSRILIYGLLSPIDNCLFYIGQTKKRREFRLLEHIQEAVQGTKTPVYNDIRRYMFMGSIPEIFVVEKVTDIELANERELYWINWFNDLEKSKLPISWKPQTPKSLNKVIEKIVITNVRK